MYPFRDTRIFNKERLVLLTDLNSHRKCYLWKGQQNLKKWQFSPALCYCFFTVQKICLFLIWLPAKSHQYTTGGIRDMQTSAPVPSHLIFRVLRAIVLAWISTQTGTFLNKEKHSHLHNLTLVTSISLVLLCAPAAGRHKTQPTHRHYLIVFKEGSYGFKTVQIKSIGPLDKLEEIEILLDLIKFILSWSKATTVQFWI